MTSSLIPSPRYSFSFDPLMLTNGRTAIERSGLDDAPGFGGAAAGDRSDGVRRRKRTVPTTTTTTAAAAIHRRDEDVAARGGAVVTVGLANRSRSSPRSRADW